MASDNRSGQAGSRPLSALLARVLDPVCARRGLANATLLAAWPEIVGQRYARATLPEKLSFPRGSGEEAGVLTLQVDRGAALYLAHESDQLIERINGFLGFRAVARIRMVQRPIAAKEPNRPKPARALAPEEEAALASSIAAIEDNSLRAALDALGRAVISHTAGHARDRGEQTS